MKRNKKIALAANVTVIAAIFILNFFYQKNGFDFTLKCICSGLFALLGALNLVCGFSESRKNQKFYIAMAAGLMLAFLGDVLIGFDFIVGAATFALGHVCFVIAYCFTERLTTIDLTISGALFLGSALFLTLSPLLTFDTPVFRIVCIVYALIISLMLGKAIGNLIRKRCPFTITVAAASTLFFFSDLMLVFDWFIGKWSWTDNACMGTYYPALCLLAFSMILYKKEK